MNFKVAERKPKVAEESFMKNYMKPIGLKFDDQHENVKQCKSAYKKHYKEIGIPVNLSGDWFTDGDGNNVLQICTLYEKPDEKKCVEFEIGHGIFIVYQFQRYQIKDPEEVKKLQKQFSDLDL